MLGMIKRQKTKIINKNKNKKFTDKFIVIFRLGKIKTNAYTVVWDDLTA